MWVFTRMVRGLVYWTMGERGQRFGAAPGQLRLHGRCCVGMNGGGAGSEKARVSFRPCLAIACWCWRAGKDGCLRARAWLASPP